MGAAGANLASMSRRFLTLLVALATVAVYLPAAHAAAGALAAAPAGPCGAPVCAGYGEADATWHVGAGAGQYSNKDPMDPTEPGGYQDGLQRKFDSVQDGETDPHGHSITQDDSYGVQSRLSYRAIVVQDAEGDQEVFVKSDSYLAQDYLSRRAAQILELNGSGISYDEIFLMASHNHSSPYYMTPSPGPWIFQDAFDIRAFEYHARALAQAIMNAESAMVPARMGATVVQHTLFKGMIARKGFGDDGTPTGYPDDFGDLGLSVVRFDDISDPANPKPLATLINWGQHPEDLDGYNLITGEYVAHLERMVEEATGAPLVFGQGDVGSSEAGPGRPEDVAALGIPARWSHAGHAQTERGAYLLSRDVIKAWTEIADPSAAPLVPYSSNFDVEAGNAFVAGPYSHPYPAANSCRSETTMEGDPGVGTAADCTRADNTGVRDFTGDSDNEFWDTLKENGVPIPDNYDTPSYFALEENARIHLQAFKLGEVVFGSCSCEAQVDLILNFESRANEVQGDIWDGFDWTAPNKLPLTGEVLPAPLNCTQANPPDGDWACTRNPAYPRQRALLNPFTMTDYEYDHMKAEIHNDAAGWNDPQNVVQAQSEPHDPQEIFGNFTKSELSPSAGYKLAIGVGHAGDYNGYTVSYREYMAYDHYRKALTSYGPHTADYMSTRMVELAAQLNGVPQPELEQDIARGAPDEARQLVMSTALGAASNAAYEAWYKALPVDKSSDDDPVGEAITQPANIHRFDAATFSWRGGSNAIDNPHVTVQRQVNGEWKDFAIQNGAIQTKVDFPNGVNAFADTYSGNQEWTWTANFEAFDAFPAEIGSTPTGTYRFAVDGKYRAAPASDSDYEATSRPFTVSPWEGIGVHDVTTDADGSVSFKVDPIQYPTTYHTDFGYVQDSGKTPQGDDVIKTDELGKPFCTTCTFRPWAPTGEVATATVTIVRADGSTEQVAASKGADGRYHAPVTIYQGDDAYVARGGVVDNYGEINGNQSGHVTGTEPRPEPTPTPTETASPSPTEASPTIPDITPTETATPEPTETTTPEPTATETAEPTPTATHEPTPRPTHTNPQGGGGGGGNGGGGGGEPSSSPTSEPTVNPADRTTTLNFTDTSATSGQFSDEANLAARLVDATGDPIEHATLSFDLRGADGDATYSGETGNDGVATVAVPLFRTPGSYMLTVHFAGDDDHTESADLGQFVIEKEDTSMNLARTGAKLRAAVADADSSKGIAGLDVIFMTRSQVIGEGATNRRGVVTARIPKRFRHGRRPFTAIFEGTDTYEPSRGRTR
jgi:hypothetical protein